MTEDEALKQFGTILPWFRECWMEGWNDYRHKRSHPMDDPRARSVMIQNSATIYARSTCGKQPGISYKNFNSRHLFLFGDLAVLQFKKLAPNERNGQLVPSNNLNPTATAFDEQQPLEGLIIAPRITVGYYPNEFHSDLSIYLLHTKSPYENNWIADISATPVSITPTLFENIDEQLSTPQKRVRPRTDRAAHSDGTEAAQG